MSLVASSSKDSEALMSFGLLDLVQTLYHMCNMLQVPWTHSTDMRSYLLLTC